MGTIQFHLTSDDVDLIHRHRRGERLTPDELTAAKLVCELSNLNDLLSEPADEQLSPDGYGVQDGAKL